MIHAADGGDRIRTINAACAASCRAGINSRPAPRMGDGSFSSTDGVQVRRVRRFSFLEPLAGSGTSRSRR